MGKRTCPNCGTSEDFFEIDSDTGEKYCGACCQVLDDSPAPEPQDNRSRWIVGSPAPREGQGRDAEAQMRWEGQMCLRAIEEAKAANEGELPPPPPRIITYDSLYTS